MHLWRAIRRWAAGVTASAMLLAASGGAVAGPASPLAPAALPQGVFLVHTATSANIDSATTYLDHPLLNGNPAAIFVASHRWTSAVGVFDHDLGAYYDSSIGRSKWGIFNEDAISMPEGATFNVYIPPNGPNSYVHETTAKIVQLNWSDLDPSPLVVDGNTVMFTLHNYNAFNHYFDYSLGVYFNFDVWAVFLQDTSAAMPVEEGFNVHLEPPSEYAFVQVTTVDNNDLGLSYIDHPQTNGRPEAVMVLTQNWSVEEVYFDAVVGLDYSAARGQWYIFPQNTALDIPLGAAFNVLVNPRTVYLPLIAHP